MGQKGEDESKAGEHVGTKRNGSKRAVPEDDRKRDNGLTDARKENKKNSTKGDPR